jgi:ankyrin repeat protein
MPIVSDAMQALYAGDRERAERLLPADDALTVFDAAAFGKLERLEALLDDDPARAQGFSDDGFTALHLACFAEQEGAARLLIERGAGVDVLSTGSIARVPPLGTAAFVRSVPLARLLLDSGADVNAQGEGGFTALHAAAQNGDEAFAELLLERGADPGLAAADGRRPVDLAQDSALREMLAP